MLDWPQSFNYLGYLNVLDYGVSPTGDPLANAAALQALLDGAFGFAIDGAPPVWIPPHLTFSIGAPVTLRTAGSILGPGFQGNGPTIRYVGPDNTDAIQVDLSQPQPKNSKVRLEGFRLEDHRVNATAGHGLKLTSTNGCIVQNVGSFDFPDAAIYCGNTTGTPDNYTVRHCWVRSRTYGVVFDHVTENALMEDIKGDANLAAPMKSLCYLTGNPGTGYSNTRAYGLKAETVLGVPVDLLGIDATYNGTFDTAGLHLGPNGGYIVNNQSARVKGCIRAYGTPGPISGLINDLGTIIGDGKTVLTGNQQLLSHP